MSPLTRSQPPFSGHHQCSSWVLLGPSESSTGSWHVYSWSVPRTAMSPRLQVERERLQLRSQGDDVDAGSAEPRKRRTCTGDAGSSRQRHDPGHPRGSAVPPATENCAHLERRCRGPVRCLPLYKRHHTEHPQDACLGGPRQVPRYLCQPVPRQEPRPGRCVCSCSLPTRLA